MNIEQIGKGTGTPCKRVEAVLFDFNLVHHYWDQISQELDLVPHIWADHWTKEDLYNHAMQGTIQVWGVGPSDTYRLIVFTQVCEFPASRFLSLFLAIGNLDEGLVDVLKHEMIKFGVMAECTMFEVRGRPGWEKLLAPSGAKKVAVILQAPLVKERIN